MAINHKQQVRRTGSVPAKPILTDAGITSQLVRAVADKVYVLWLRELAVERERRRRR